MSSILVSEEAKSCYEWMCRKGASIVIQGMPMNKLTSIYRIVYFGVSAVYWNWSTKFMAAYKEWMSRAKDYIVQRFYFIYSLCLITWQIFILCEHFMWYKVVLDGLYIWFYDCLCTFLWFMYSVARLYIDSEVFFRWTYDLWVAMS